MKKNPSPEISWIRALCLIALSTLLISGSAYVGCRYYQHQRLAKLRDPAYALRSIIQTGPQKEALKTEYLAELLGISADRPPCALIFDVDRAKKRLLSSPLIARAEMKIFQKNTLYIDYTVRQPIAWIEDYENVAVDKEGYLFPFTPFFAPKNLPSLYLGLAPFSTLSEEERPIGEWNRPLEGKYAELAFKILEIVTQPDVSDLFNVRRIDVSNAFADSYGSREIVVITEDRLYPASGGTIVLPRFLRLTTKNYAQELGNYLELREKLLAEERKGPISKGKVLDFRIDKLAFIDTL
ncbi:MAG: hypothetical protein JSS61_01050 [Verrucomicrobia bacterium]|nr:hypothetical protein [Verrucomicrobiota bacterium]